MSKRRRSLSQNASPEPRSLPRQPTPFVGRREELAEIARLLADGSCRLLTLVGPGGVGKTRLAIEAANRADRRPADGVAFVPLQGVQPGYLTSAIADAAGIPSRGQVDPHARLLSHLKDREMLLVLDSFEHLIEAGTALLPEILDAAPGVCLLVTSREVLNLREEWQFHVRGLDVPTTVSAGELATYSAAQLFAGRARHVRRDFSLEEERAGVVRICQLVEGMPLALELAASWLTTLRCAEIAAEIHRHLDFLSTHLRDLPEGHRSMQAVFDQSWNLLSEEEKRVMARLSVFDGGFQLEAAREVAGASLDTLSRLVDKSLLRRDPDGRYQIHELLRQYAAEQLATVAGAEAKARGLHCAFYAGFLKQRRRDIDHGPERVREIEAELENLRAAWQWAIDRGNLEAIHRAVTPWFYFCQIQSRYREGEAVLAAAARSLAQTFPSPVRDRTLAKVLDSQGWLCIRLGKVDLARQVLERSADLYAKLGTPPPSGMGTDPRTALGVLATTQGDYARAMTLGEEARRASNARHDLWNHMFAHYVLAGAALAQGQVEAAGRYARRGREDGRRLNARWFMAYFHNQLGDVARAQGNYDEARQHYQDSYATREAFDDPEGMAVALNHLGRVALLQGDDEEATRLYSQSEAIYREIGDRGGLASALDGLGCAACLRGNVHEAARDIHDALQIADESQLLPLTLSILVSAGELWLHAGRPVPAGRVLALVQLHPASPRAALERSRQLLAQHRIGGEGQGKSLSAPPAQDVAASVVAVLTRLAAFAQETLPPRTADPASQPLVEPLTPRELEVLDLLAAGMTNRDIADELVLAVGTVKWYTGQIYGKLGVDNRTQAAARARELAILES